VCDDHLYFILGFSFYWFQEVCSMDIVFLIRSEKGGMEDGVDSPLYQEL